MCFLYSFSIAPYPNLPQYFKDINHSCVYGCSDTTNSCNNIQLPRGKKYIIEKIDPVTKSKLDKCSFTFWNLSHFFMYAIVTTICPELALYFLGIGVLFEIYEYVVYDCYDVMDIFANTLGVGVGLPLSKFINRPI